ncbi:UDP-N-acetylmuramyl-tripeptide synthetase [Candidatus Woesebacteria bacterium]|nr:UDP-N-acetylmuramyl-tripeptide synthetase [Candidatus Woesebacteria bacterium]
MVRYYVQRIKNIYHFFVAIIANLYYGWPSRKIKVIGITGTDGKTTTTLLVHHILKSAHKKTSVISTNLAYIAGKKYDTGFHVTTPDAFTIQKFLRKAVDYGDEYFVLETTSHALDQYRVWGVQYVVTAITNITHEHLFDHFTYKNYLKAKAHIVLYSEKGFINVDDASFSQLSEFLVNRKAEKKVATYGLKGKADYQLDVSQKLRRPIAEFNKYNYLAAYALCRECGLTDRQIFDAMNSYTLPIGRLEVVYDKDFTVIIDFAHTPNGLHQALASIKKLYPGRRLIHVFGAAALRDNTKRPMMGRESGTYADLTLLTEEDYRTEDPNEICEQIAVGLKKKGFSSVAAHEFGKKSRTYSVIVDRGEAIQKAIEVAKKNDVLVLTGKGHEKSLCREKKEYDWSEHEAVEKALKQRD